MLGDNIKKYRKLNNMSQDELAEKLNVTRQSVSLWETGQTQPSLDNIIAFTKLFDITTDDLLLEANLKSVERDANKEYKKKQIIILITCFVVIGVLLATVLMWNFDDSESKNNSEVIQVTDSTKNREDMFRYFKNFAAQNGVVNGDHCYYSKSANNYGGDASENFTLYYWGDTDTVEFCLHRVVDDTFSINFYLHIPKNNTGEYKYMASYYYRNNGEPLYQAEGVITASEFTVNYPLTCTEYIGTADKQNEFMEVSRKGICEVISCLEEFTRVEKLEYSFSDFGFTNF